MKLSEVVKVFGILLFVLMCTIWISNNTTEAARLKAKNPMSINLRKIKTKVGKKVRLKIRKAEKKVKWTVSNSRIKLQKTKGKKKAQAIFLARSPGKSTVTAKVGKKKFTCKINIDGDKSLYTGKVSFHVLCASTSNVIPIRMTNAKRKEFVYGADYELQKWEDNTWNNVKQMDQAYKPIKDYLFAANSRREENLYLDIKYNNLVPGTYRIYRKGVGVSNSFRYITPPDISVIFRQDTVNNHIIYFTLKNNTGSSIRGFYDFYLQRQENGIWNDIPLLRKDGARIKSMISLEAYEEQTVLSPFYLNDVFED
ncbi:MAG: hypothetical protein LBR68_04720, partial [Lachnoclostridium sp.]|nr:hypothetical protein [Lachnoclostridium sp.]